MRVGLSPAVAMSAVAVNTTPAEKKAIAVLLALAIWAARQRSRIHLRVKEIGRGQVPPLRFFPE